MLCLITCRFFPGYLTNIYVTTVDCLIFSRLILICGILPIIALSLWLKWSQLSIKKFVSQLVMNGKVWGKKLSKNPRIPPLRNVEKFELTKNEQWERLNAILLILALILSCNIVGIFFKLYFDGFLGDYNNIFIKKSLYISEDQTVGFPILHLAILTDTGLLDDFSIEGKKNRTFLKLQEEKTKDSAGSHIALPPYAKFAFYYKSSIYFLTCNPDGLVIKYNIDDNSHRTIPDSLIPNLQLIYAKGIQVGNYFWIFDGTGPLFGRIMIIEKLNID